MSTNREEREMGIGCEHGFVDGCDDCEREWAVKEAVEEERERCAGLLRDAADQYRRDGWDREADAIYRLLQEVAHP
jgi:hypothetical protein